MIDGTFSHHGGKMRGSLRENIGLDMVLEAAKNRLAVKGYWSFSMFVFLFYIFLILTILILGMVISLLSLHPSLFEPNCC